VRIADYCRTWIRKEIEKYSEQLGIRHEEIPITILTGKEWLALPKEITRGKRTIMHKRHLIILSCSCMYENTEAQMK
jgi:hypothetical protein